MWHCQSFCCCREYLNVSWDYVGGDSCSKLFKWFTNGIHGKNGGEIKSNRNKLSTTIHLDLWPYSTVQQLGIKYAYNLLGELWDLKEKMRLFIWHLSLLLLRLFYSLFLVFVFLFSLSISLLLFDFDLDLDLCITCNGCDAVLSECCQKTKSLSGPTLPTHSGRGSRQ